MCVREGVGPSVELGKELSSSYLASPGFPSRGLVQQFLQCKLYLGEPGSALCRGRVHSVRTPNVRFPVTTCCQGAECAYLGNFLVSCVTPVCAVGNPEALA